jgi:hypothetical protein
MTTTSRDGLPLAVAAQADAAIGASEAAADISRKSRRFMMLT